jgi:aspartate aminotransferase
VALGFGEANIAVLPALAAQLRDAADQAHYGPVAGIARLRGAVAGYLSRRGVACEASQVLTGPGTKPLLFAILGALGGPVALPRPCWVSYAAQAAMQRIVSVTVPIARPSDGGVPDPSLLEAAAARLRDAGTPLRAALVTIPDNPTGTVAAADVIRRFCDVATTWDLVVISDEIYGDLTHDGAPAVTPSRLIPDRTVVTTGLSKNLAVGGWRIGAARFPLALADVQRSVEIAASEIWSAPPYPVQHAAAWAFAEPPQVVERVAASQRLHGTVAAAVAQRFAAGGAQVASPRAGFYIYPELPSAPAATSDELVHTLLTEHGIATLPGSVFGDDPAKLALRIATPMLYGENPEQRQAALESDDPAALPWVAADLERLSVALDRLMTRRI